MAIPFQLNTAIPMSYQPGPSVLEQARSIMSLADLMDQRKFRRTEFEQNQAEYERKKRAQEMIRKSLKEYGESFINTPNEIQSTPIQQTPSIKPIQQTPFEQKLDGLFPSIEPVEPVEQTPIGTTDIQDYQASLNKEMGRFAPKIAPEIVPEMPSKPEEDMRIASADINFVTAPSDSQDPLNELLKEKIAEKEKKSDKENIDKALSTYGMPTSNDFGLNERQSKQYYKLLTIDPEYATNWAKSQSDLNDKVIERRYKETQIKKYEEEIEKQHQSMIRKTGEYWAYSGMNLIPDIVNWKNLSDDQKKQINDALSDAAASASEYTGMSLPTVITQPVTDKNYRSIIALMKGFVSPKDAASIDLLTAQKKTEETKPALITAQTETEKEKPAVIRAQVAKMNAETQKLVNQTKNASMQTNIWKTWNIPSGSADRFAAAEQAMDYANVLYKALHDPNIATYLATGKKGEFINPEVNNAVTQLKELWGRAQSGAAISEQEWKAFERELFNTSYLLTDAGRKTAIQTMNSFMGRQQTFGSAITKDPDWYTKLKEEKAIKQPPSIKPKTDADMEYDPKTGIFRKLR